MAVTSGTVQLSANLTQTISSGVVSAQNIPATLSTTTSYSNGTGVNQYDQIYAKQLTLAATPTDLDLSAIPDLNGTSQNMARVRYLDIQVVTATAGDDLTLGDAVSNAFAAFWGATGTDKVFAGSRRVWNDPTSTGAGVGAVTSGTSKILRLNPGANTITVNVVILGCSAV